MQIKGLIRLVSLITIIGLMPISTTYAGCPCENDEGDSRYSQDQQSNRNTEDPD